jgi:hypothetical protein
VKWSNDDKVYFHEWPAGCTWTVSTSIPEDAVKDFLQPKNVDKIMEMLTEIEVGNSGGGIGVVL